MCATQVDVINFALLELFVTGGFSVFIIGMENLGRFTRGDSVTDPVHFNLIDSVDVSSTTATAQIAK